MENSTPLLSDQSNPAADQITISVDQTPSFVSLDEIIEESLGGFGCSQLRQAVLVSMPMVFDAQQTFISVYTDAEPTWHCTNNTTRNSSSDICSLSKSAWAWDGPSYKTIISEWGLECSSSILTGLPSSCFFMGCLLGGFILATQGDSSLGRKKLLFLSSFAMSIAAFATIFSPDIWVYSSLRFVCGFFRASIITTALVLLMEMVGKKWRGQSASMAFFCFTLGLLSLPAIAYLKKDSPWKTLYVWTSIPGIFYCLLAFPFVTESPRWLFLHGYEAEALKALKSLASKNLDQNVLCLSNLPPKEEITKLNLYTLIKELFKRRWALRRLLTIMAVGFGIGMVYYGMLLGVGNLGSNIYLSLTLNALLEIPAYFLTFFLIGKWKRTSSVLAFSTLSGAFSLICAVIGDGRKGLLLGLELASFFGVCVAFDVLLIYSTELFPTSVRNSTMSIVRQAIMLGAVFSPIVIAGGGENGFASFGVFGFVALCSGLFVGCLPETRGVSLCETLDEQERRDGIVMLVS